MDHKRKRIVLKLLLGYGMLCVCYSIGLTFSRYYSSGAFDSSLGVAKWRVSVDNTLSNSNLNLVCGNNTQSYTFSVASESEVSAKYHVILSDLPNEIEVSLDGGTFQTPTNHSLTYENVGVFNVQDAQTEHEHTLTFRAPLSSTMPSVNQINMEVKFSQVI